MTEPARILRLKMMELFGADLRSLALFRICLAILILFDLATRLPDIEVFYTDFGLHPRATLVSRTPALISLHLMSGSMLIQAILFAVQAVCAIGLLLGYRTRLMVFFSWLLMASLQARNRMILGGGDEYLRYVLFWSMFLPLSARCSLDSTLDESAVKQRSYVCNWATAAFTLQNIVVYLMAAAFKLRTPQWTDGSAIYYALNIFNYAREQAAQLLLPHTDFLKFLTYAVLVIEVVVPLMFLVPFKTGPVRVITYFLFLLLHIGFFSCFYLKNFPWISMIALMVFLPPWFWDHIPIRWSEFVELRSRRFTDPLKNLAARLSWRPTPFKVSAVSETCVIFFLFCVLYWNVASFFKFKIPEPIRLVCSTAALQQRWSMFTPPSHRSGWLVIPGKLKNKNVVDLYRNGGPVSWDKPPLALVNKNARWQRYVMINYVFKRNKYNWPDYAAYLCRSWNAHHANEQRLESLEIDFMGRETPPPGEARGFTKSVLLRQDCAAAAGQSQQRQKKRVPKSGTISPPSTDLNMPSAEIPSGGTRAAVEAGIFYPADALQLNQTVDELIGRADQKELPGELLAMIVPHAAYEYSGAVAAAGIKNIGKDWSTVILIGPSHKEKVDGGALWARGAFSTPLGDVPVDEPLAQKILASSKFFHDLAVPHQKEHSLEVELPLLQRTLGSGFKIVPILVGTTDLEKCRDMGKSIAHAIKGQKILVLISTDLSHYPDHESAQKIDATTLLSIAQLHTSLIQQTADLLMQRGSIPLKTTMCGLGALETGLVAAKVLGANDTRVLNYADSSISVHGNPERVVGYAAIAVLKGPNGNFEVGHNLPLDAETKEFLLRRAADSIQAGLEQEPDRPIELSDNPVLNLPATVFITLSKNGELRGYAGSETLSGTLLEAVTTFARKAAFDDLRFPPLTKEELPSLRIAISVRSPSRKIHHPEEIIVGKHGVDLVLNNQKGSLPPSAWKEFSTRDQFLAQACANAKLPADCWKDPATQLHVFNRDDFGMEQ